YNVTDTRATGLISNRRKFEENTNEQSSLTRTDRDALAFNGQQIKTMNQVAYAVHTGGGLLCEKARHVMQRDCGAAKGEYRAPYLVTPEERQAKREAQRGKTKAELMRERMKYTGGYVISPPPAYWNEPLITLDFESLYPTIIADHELCWSTWIPHRKDEDGRLEIMEYQGSRKPMTDMDPSKYMLWYLSEPRPRPEVVGDRILILVAEDWGHYEGKNRKWVTCIEAAKWTAYQQYLKLRELFPSKRAFEFVDPIPKMKPVPEWKPTKDYVCKTYCHVVNRGSMFAPILRNLMKARAVAKLAKKEAIKAKNAAMEDVCEARQLQIKLAANASYGFAGAAKGYLGGLSIAALTCLLGRHYIMISALTSEGEYDKPSVYGDTDSIFTRDHAITTGNYYGARKHIQRLEAIQRPTEKDKAELAKHRAAFEIIAKERDRLLAHVEKEKNDKDDPRTLTPDEFKELDFEMLAACKLQADKCAEAISARVTNGVMRIVPENIVIRSAFWKAKMYNKRTLEPKIETSSKGL
ncbi:MAG TPA: DNA polymerase domain-containing protein, partial [Pirellula sp.]|nr:DNA polymerase domain-containing protein [Pirellula sp.]